MKRISICESNELTYSKYEDQYNSSHQLARWLFKYAEVKVNRIYPAHGAAIAVFNSIGDVNKAMICDKMQYVNGKSMNVRILTDEAYQNIRGQAQTLVDQWTWSVIFVHDDFNWLKDDDA